MLHLLGAASVLPLRSLSNGRSLIVVLCYSQREIREPRRRANVVACLNLCGGWMIKLVLIITGLALIGIYAYQSPSIAFRKIEATVAANDVDTFSTEINHENILRHLRNRMSLQMQDALGSYSTRPDPATTEARLSPYFDKRSAALATPASLLRELSSQMRRRSDDLDVRFTSSSAVRINWTSGGLSREALLFRDGLSWKLAALDFGDAMPRFWDQPTTLLGTYHQSEFENCCVDGQATKMPYSQLRLSTAMDVLDLYPESEPDWNRYNVVQVQIGADARMFASIKNDDLIKVHCKQLWQGISGHYALPVYCVADQITPLISTR